MLQQSMGLTGVGLLIPVLLVLPACGETQSNQGQLDLAGSLLRPVPSYYDGLAQGICSVIHSDPATGSRIVTCKRGYLAEIHIQRGIAHWMQSRWKYRFHEGSSLIKRGELYHLMKAFEDANGVTVRHLRPEGFWENWAAHRLTREHRVKELDYYKSLLAEAKKRMVDYLSDGAQVSDGLTMMIGGSRTATRPKEPGLIRWNRFEISDEEEEKYLSGRCVSKAPLSASAVKRAGEQNAGDFPCHIGAKYMSQAEYDLVQSSRVQVNMINVFRMNEAQEVEQDRLNPLSGSSDSTVVVEDQGPTYQCLVSYTTPSKEGETSHSVPQSTVSLQGFWDNTCKLMQTYALISEASKCDGGRVSVTVSIPGTSRSKTKEMACRN